MSIFLAFVGLFFLLNSASAQENPCKDHTILERQYKRSVRYVSENSQDDPYLCDSYLRTGWYYFGGGQGDEMPTEAPPPNSCGTAYPVWLNGTLPSVDDGVVNRTGCTVVFGNNCTTSYNIQVQNCEDVGYVYHLEPTVTCPEAYCMGEELPCPNNQSSETGFTPGCTSDGFPILVEEPYITFRVQDAQDDCWPKTVVMQCNIDESDESLFMDVHWYIDGTEVKSNIGENSIQLKDFPAELYEIDWVDTASKNLDVDVTCLLRPRYSRTEIPGSPVASDFYMGFIVTPDSEYLTVVENGPPANYTLRPTIPVLCPTNWETNEDDCPCTGLYIEVYEPKIPEGSGAPAAMCPEDGSKYSRQTVTKHVTDSDDLTEPTACGMIIPEVLNPDATTWFHLPIYASTDNSYDGDINLLLELKTPKVHYTIPIWQNYRLPTATVAVIDQDTDIQGMMCKARDDPHMMTIDGRCYENDLAGEFIMLRHKTLPIDIHGYFVQRGTTAYSDVCGVAVRAGGDLFIYDDCPGASTGRVRLYKCDEMQLKVIELDATTYKIILPTGAYVKVSTGYVEYQPSVQDIEKVYGLCGTFTFRCDDDFQLPDYSYWELPGETDQPCERTDDQTEAGAHCAWNEFEPDEFCEDWRVPPEQSLFNGTIYDKNRMTDAYYCSCNNEDDPDNPTVTCDVTPDQDACVDGDEIDYERCYEQAENRRRIGRPYTDDVEDEVVMFDYDPNFKAAPANWSDEWTFETAKQECMDYFRAVSAAENCFDVAGVDWKTALADCILDIKITHDTQFNLVHLGAILSQCEKELGRNMSLFTYDNSTGTATPPEEELGAICENNCYMNGNCTGGVCHCYEGYAGKTCGLDLNKVPEIQDLPQRGACDIQTRPCLETPVQGSYFLRSRDLRCRLRSHTISLTGEVTEAETLESLGTYEHLKRMFCRIPQDQKTDPDVLAMGYVISVSNNAVNFSNEVNLVVEDTKCMKCSKDFTCVRLPRTCYIDNVCYEDGETAETYGIQMVDPQCLMCDSTIDTGNWTEVTTGACAPEAPEPEGGDTNSALVISLSVLAVAAVAVGAAFGGVFVYKKKSKSSRISDSSWSMQSIGEPTTPRVE